jgi:hypothetical protein
MPRVGDEEFDYTPEGMAEAQQKSEMTGMPVTNAMERSMTEYAGGGKTGYGKIGMYKEGDMVPKKKKSGDDTLHPEVKEFGKEVSTAVAGLASAAFKAPSKIVKGVKKSAKQIKDSAYKEQVEVKDGKKTGKKRRKKLFKDKK